MASSARRMVLTMAVVTFDLRFPDPEFAEAFRAYVNYFEDLAGVIHGQFGWEESLVDGVYAALAAHPPLHRIQRRRLTPAETDALERALRKVWGFLRRAQREVADPETYDEEANAWLPEQCYYAVYHAALALALATGQRVPRAHAAALKLMGKEVRRGLLPYPWSAWCEGGPALDEHRFGGFSPSGEVHVLSRPDPDTAPARLAMFLRTTRGKELDRQFGDERRKKVAPGRGRRNLSSDLKREMASRVAATTLFDVFWRLRKKAHYGDADVFVLGAVSELDARRFGSALLIVTDATVAAIEAVIAASVGPTALARTARNYTRKTEAAPDSLMGRRATAWSSRAVARNASSA